MTLILVQLRAAATPAPPLSVLDVVYTHHLVTLQIYMKPFYRKIVAYMKGPLTCPHACIS